MVVMEFRKSLSSAQLGWFVCKVAVLLSPPASASAPTPLLPPTIPLVIVLILLTVSTIFSQEVLRMGGIGMASDHVSSRRGVPWPPAPSGGRPRGTTGRMSTESGSLESLSASTAAQDSNLVVCCPSHPILNSPARASFSSLYCFNVMQVSSVRSPKLLSGNKPNEGEALTVVVAAAVLWVPTIREGEEEEEGMVPELAAAAAAAVVAAVVVGCL
mmetsp:Transcript_12321/g.20613  ORF Transcript_12321/g.20613 Transcript_12321/m.20613 type:complete len:215 (-) Transcript_12321:558-1202(-)